MFVKRLININNIRFKSTKSTIFALSSGQGKCGVAVIRLTGPNAGDAIKAMTTLKDLPKPRQAMLRSIRHPQTKETIDKGLILWFPSPHSFTGEDSCEFQVHGSLAVISAILNSLGTLPRTRLAEPGEFTKRAFFNGKLDLTEVEGLSDLLQAETEAQRKQAFLQSQGFLSKVYSSWRKVLLRNLAHVEAYIDFEETEEVDDGLFDAVENSILDLEQEIKAHLSDGKKGEILRTGVKTIILGEPNVGKSSLINLLCGRPAAIVTSIKGTTRDILEIKLDIKGYPILLMDTAGLRKDSTDPIEQEGIKRALAASRDDADLIILVIDALKYNKWQLEHKNEAFSDYIKYYSSEIGLDTSKPMFYVVNKIDLLETELVGVQQDKMVLMSCKKTTGISNLVENLGCELKKMCGDPSEEHPSMNQARHKQHLQDCLIEINYFIKKIDSKQNIDIVILAEYLRKALKHLGKLTGVVTTDQILDVIFKDFCIGK